MEESNQSEGGEGDKAKIQQEDEQLDPNAKRCKIENILDAVGEAIDKKLDEGTASGSSGCFCGTSTSSNTSCNKDEVVNQNTDTEVKAPEDTLNSDDSDDLAPAELPSEDEVMEPEVILEAEVDRDQRSNDGDRSVRQSPVLESCYSTDDVLESTESEEEEEPAVLQKTKPKHNWFMIPEIQNRQFGASACKESSIQFQRRCYGSLHCVERLELMYKLERHTGCVNSINFHPNGSLLASGSDDLSIVVWDWKLGNSLLAFDSKHKNNVFQSKFLPLSGDMHIVSCARDGQVRLAQISAQEGFKSTRRLGAHRGPSHKLTVLHDKPQVVISVGEDGVVLRHDLRAPKSEKIITVRRDYLDVALYSISSNPIDSNEYCVAGKDYRVRTYDLRKNGVNPLKIYAPFDKLSEKQKSLHVTCAVYNHNGSEILASYNDEFIYLFDVNGPQNSYAHCYQGHRNIETIKGVNFFGPKSEFVISGSDCGYVYFWEKNSEAIVQFLRADDNGIVNCLEPHPQIPFLATSGLDYDIKIWVPSYEQDPKLEDLQYTVKMNMKPNNSDYSLQNSEFRHILFVLRSLHSTDPTMPVEPTEEISSPTSSDESDSPSSVWTTTTSEHDSNDSDFGPDECAPF